MAALQLPRQREAPRHCPSLKATFLLSLLPATSGARAPSPPASPPGQRVQGQGGLGRGGGARATADSSRPVLCKTQSQAAAGRGEAGMAPQRVTQCPKLWQTGQGGSEQGLLLDPRLKQQPGDSHSTHGQHAPSSLCPGCSFHGC